MRQWLWAVLMIGAVLGESLQARQLGDSNVILSSPFELTSDFLIVVDGQIENLDGLKFIVDTGATHSAIDRGVAQRLQLKRQSGKIMNFDRSIPIEWADLPSLSLGSLRVEGIRVMVVDLAHYSELAKGVDGIIGLDLLSKNEKFIIDYSKKHLYFERAQNRIQHPAPAYFAVPIIVQGVAMRLEVDTGVSQILLYRDRLKKRLVNLRYEGEPKPVTMGRIKGAQITLPDCKISGSDESLKIILIDAPREKAAPTLDGYLAVAALHAKRIEFDFTNMMLLWQ
jgi:predicted aspartyl protease